MTMERQDITEDFYSGNTKFIRDTITNPDGSPKDLTSAEVTFSLFTQKDQIVVVKSSAVGTDEIEITDLPGGIAVIKLLPADTVGLVGTFGYHVNVVDSMGYEETVTSGKINIYKSYARRPRKDSLPAFVSGLSA